MTSEAELTRKSNVQQANNIMQHSGWLDALPEREAVTKATRLTFNEDKTGGDWRNVLNEERQKVLEAREAEASQKKNGTKGKGGINNEVNEVKVIDKRYFMSNKFRASNAAAQKLIDDTVLEFSLNEAQERAFRIVANHAVEPNGEHLKMYLGGMAGTGKSQVIKALIHFFATRQESYRFMSMAPTGTAAALIGGSTYHSILGLRRSRSGESVATVIQVYERLKNVEYVFMDEVSMLDCNAMYTICSKMCRALHNDGRPFGGINMIFAGDFAQLPPAVGGQPLYSHKVGRVLHRTHSHLHQQASIGKALWHQFTTVVILRENMRQRSQTPDDAKLRVALENLRYKTCTEQDIKLLH